DVLSFINTVNVTGNFNAGTGVLTLTGTDTLANYESALESITYTNTNTDNPNTGNRTITWMVNDGSANSAAVTSTITITPVNDVPAAADDTIILAEGGSVIIDLAANDVDVDNALALNSIVITGAPVNGSLIVNTDGTVDYTHDGSQTSSDSFTYTIADITGAISNIATVNVTVTPVNNAPTTIGIADVTITEDSPSTSIDLHAAFDDVDNLDSELTYSITGNTSIGLFTTASVNSSSGELLLDYAADMNGAAQISIRATDPSGASVDTLFTVTVTPVNDTPVLAANTGMSASATNGNLITNAELNVNDVDNPDTAIVYTVTALPTSGVLMLDGVPLTINGSFTEDDVVNNRLSYQADATSTTDQFAFIVSDGDGGAITANTFEIIVQFALPSPEPEPEPETIVPDAPPVITGSPAEGDPESTINVAEVESEDSRDIDGLYVGGSFRSIPQPGLTLEPVQPIALDQPTQNDFGGVVKTVEPSGIYDEVNLVTASTVADIQIKSIKALWVAIDDMRQQIDEDLTEDITQVQVKLGAISGSGVALTAGIVAWVLRSGALMTSLISTIPLWKGYDPLPILAYRDDDEEKDNLTEDKIPTSLEELKKIKELREKMKKYNQVDDMFSGSEIKG
ncbi:MAG: tandem-95 repeat protein, partial [Gammaproteobacteria bacterium]|nr:tandem-95 repeat protein [Gammaproteobacteria bacterium]